MIKLLDSSGVFQPIHMITPEKNSYFTAEIRKRSPYDFIMVARDPFHYLNCELPLKIENIEDVPSIICQFPVISDQDLADFVDCNDDLFGIILVTFHMQILKNLFLFCGTHKIANLIIKASENQFAGLGIYEEFIKHVDKIPKKQGMNIEITIPVHTNSLADSEEFIDAVTAKFRKILWSDQKTNAAIRNYLKANVRLSIVA